MKKFLTTITFILVIVLLVGCGGSQGNITKDVVNNTINQIDNIVTTVNCLGTPNEENIKLEQNYQDSNNDVATYNNTRKPQELIFGDRNVNNNYNNMPNPQNRSGRYQNSFFDRNDYQNNNVNDDQINLTNNSYNSQNNYELTNLSTTACNSCRNYISKKDALLNSCNTCKNELVNILNNNISLDNNQLNTLKDYNSKLTEMLNNLSGCQNCQESANNIKNQNNNVLMSSRYKTLTDNLNTTSNYFEKTNTAVTDIIKIFNPKYQPKLNTNVNTGNAYQDKKEKENKDYDYSIMPINEDNTNNNNFNNRNNAYSNNKRMPERFKRNIRKTRENIINKSQNNSNNLNNIAIKPKDVRA